MSLTLEALAHSVDPLYQGGGLAYTAKQFSRALNSEAAAVERHARQQAECQETIASMQHPGLDSLASRFKNQSVTDSTRLVAGVKSYPRSKALGGPGIGFA